MRWSVARHAVTDQRLPVTKALRIVGGAADVRGRDVVAEALVGGLVQRVRGRPLRELDRRDEVGLDEVRLLGRLAALEGAVRAGALREQPAQAVELAVVEARADAARVAQR